MRWWHELKFLIRKLNRGRAERELEEEIRLHLQLETQEQIEAGLSPEEARYAAHRSFGGVLLTKERIRDVWGLRTLETLWQDLRYGVRMFFKKPGFTSIAIIALALGIGACTAIFSIVDAVLLRPLPYPEAEDILSLREVDAEGRQITFAEQNFLDVHARNHTLAAAAQYNVQLTTVLGGSEPVRTRVAFVSGDFFKTLSVQPAIGRSFLPEETKVGGHPVVVVSQGYWRRLLGSRNDLAATPLRIGDTSYTVVGVMPQSFNFPKDAEIWLPIELFPSSPSRTSHGKRVIARLRDGVTLEQARADLSAVGKQLKQENGADIDLVDLAALPLKEAMVGEASQSLLIILVAVGFLLLVACTNVANLLLARATARQREFAVRTALGATRGRLARQFIAENLMLAMLAGGVGVVLSFWGVDALISLNQGNLPRADEISVDARALAFTFALSSLVAVSLGLVPLLRFGGRDLQESLKEAARGQSANAASNHLRAMLVVTQVALTMVLLVGAGLLIKSFVKVLEIDPGFRTESAVAMEISLNDESAERRASFYQQLLERLAALPGVTAVGGVNGLPMAGGGANGQFLINNNPELKGYGEFRVASPGYFNAMGMRLVRGRLFDQSDGPETQQVALISESLARQYFSEEDPLGKAIQYGNMDGDMRLLRVVGVVSDVREFGLEANARPTVYVHYLQRPRQAWGFAIVARTQGDVKTLIPAMRSAVEALSQDVPTNIRTLDQIFSSTLNNRRFSLVIFASFAAVALLLAALGIYGVTSYAVTQRTTEIGIRIALGAQVGDVLRLVIGDGMKSVLLGIVIGLGAALALTRLIAHLLFEVSATDPLTFAFVASLLIVVAFLACYLPARRATKVDPVVTLRYE
ncbi:MAG TPA: ABC transporter permease [Blastocatellia bacterium]|nr:ABC transporter permease [Blastocatellia bacterium]